ncbi:MAG: hypothetical protein ABEI31_05760 [Halodesulfurarchaeum sp.]
MHRTDRSPSRFEAELHVQVPRNSDGDLEAAVRAQVERVDQVVEVEAIQLHGLQPRLNDLAVEATVQGSLQPNEAYPGPEAVAEVLSAGFGIAAVEECRLPRDTRDLTRVTA